MAPQPEMGGLGLAPAVAAPPPLDAVGVLGMHAITRGGRSAASAVCREVPAVVDVHPGCFNTPGATGAETAAGHMFPDESGCITAHIASKQIAHQSPRLRSAWVSGCVARQHHYQGAAAGNHVGLHTSPAPGAFFTLHTFGMCARPDRHQVSVSGSAAHEDCSDVPQPQNENILNIHRAPSLQGWHAR